MDVFQHSFYIDFDSTYFSNHSPQTYAITDTVQKIAESYECKPIEGMLSHQLEQNIIDGEKTIIQVFKLYLIDLYYWHFAMSKAIIDKNIIMKILPFFVESQWSSAKRARQIWLWAARSVCNWCSNFDWRRPRKR